MDHIGVRRAKLEDAEEMIGILNPIIEAGAYTALDTPLTVDDQRRFIREFPVRAPFMLPCSTVASPGSRLSIEKFLN